MSDLKVAICQIKTLPGKISHNAALIKDYIEKARKLGANLAVFPELTIPGYASMDLLLNEEYLLANIKALKDIALSCKDISAIIGFADYQPGQLRAGEKPCIYNSAAFIKNTEILGVQDKTLHPDYNIFFENRYFAPSRGTKTFTVNNTIVGIEICEDLWTEGYNLAITPTEKLKQLGAELIINISASPFHINKFKSRFEIISKTAKETQTPFIYCNLTGSYDGFEGEIVFDGRSLCLNSKQKLNKICKSFEEDIQLCLPFSEDTCDIPEFEETSELYAALVLGINDYFIRLDPEQKLKAIIGLSGGIDSALVAALAVKALGPSRVLGITLPSRFNSDATRSDAKVVASNLNINFLEIPIEEQYQGILNSLTAHEIVKNLPAGVAEENIQARVRMINLMYFANKLGGVVLNTGNKTELALDNCTIYGDMVGGFSVLGDVDKDRIYSLANFINKESEIIPSSTIKRIPTAELRANQADSQVMGAEPALIAPFVREIIENNLTPKQTKERFKNSLDDKLIHRIFNQLDRSEWKRRQAAPSIRVTPMAFGNGRRIPMNHGFYSTLF
jgi:NAD+ synthase (glutamine-hydrolysing)